VARGWTAPETGTAGAAFEVTGAVQRTAARDGRRRGTATVALGCTVPDGPDAFGAEETRPPQEDETGTRRVIDPPDGALAPAMGTPSPGHLRMTRPDVREITSVRPAGCGIHAADARLVTSTSTPKSYPDTVDDGNAMPGPVV
jgi:hypothetical protein